MPFLLVETHKYFASIAALTVHLEMSLLYTLERSIQANRNINLWYEKALIYMLSRRKAPKTQQICYYTHATKTSGPFLLNGRGVGFNSRNNLANLGSFAKFLISLQFIIPCSTHLIY